MRVRKPYDRYFGIDHAWAAVDAQGFAGVFITAGWGPVPTSIDAHPAMLEIEERAVELPEGRAAWVHPGAAKAPSMISLAARGFYVYDWPPSTPTGLYELHAKPSQPVRLAELPARVAACFSPSVSLRLCFADSGLIDLKEHVNCLTSE